MKTIDPSIELVVCGSSGSGMPTFGQWEATVLAECYDSVDYVSMHTYYADHDHDTRTFLASTEDMDRFITDVCAACDYVKAKSTAKGPSTSPLTSGTYGITPRSRTRLFPSGSTLPISWRMCTISRTPCWLAACSSPCCAMPTG